MKVYLVSHRDFGQVEINIGSKAFSTQEAAEAYARSLEAWEEEFRGASPDPILSLTLGEEGFGIGVWEFSVQEEF